MTGKVPLGMRPHADVAGHVVHCEIHPVVPKVDGHGLPDFWDIRPLDVARPITLLWTSPPCVAFSRPVRTPHREGQANG